MYHFHPELFEISPSLFPPILWSMFEPLPSLIPELLQSTAFLQTNLIPQTSAPTKQSGSLGIFDGKFSFSFGPDIFPFYQTTTPFFCLPK